MASTRNGSTSLRPGSRRRCTSTPPSRGSRPIRGRIRSKRTARPLSTGSWRSTATTSGTTRRTNRRIRPSSTTGSSTRTRRSRSSSSGSTPRSTNSRPTSTGTTGRCFTSSSTSTRAIPNCTSPVRTLGAFRTTSFSTRIPTQSRGSSPSSARTPAPSRSTRSPISSNASARKGCSRTSRTRRSTPSRISSGSRSHTDSPRRGDAAPVRRSGVRGRTLYEHPDLSSVTEDSLVDGALTIRSLDALGSPPTDLPFRETGIAFRHRERTTDGDGTADSDDAALADEVAESVVGYDLVKSAELEEISAFTGPQLSFEFAVPEIVEDAVASHITTTSVPWEQPRYQNPALDITAGNHRSELADRYDAIAAEESFGDAATGETRRGRRPRHAGDRERRRPRRRGVDDDRRGHRVGRADRERSGSGPHVCRRDRGRERDPRRRPHRLTVNGAGQAPHSEERLSQRTSP